MADTVSIFVEKLSNLVLQEASLFGEVEGQVKLLRDELKWMRLFLKDADSQCLYNEKIKLWVEQVRNVTHDAEDVIDEFILHMDHRRLRLNTLKFLKCLPTCVGFADKLPFIHELDSRVKEINIRIERIMANRSKYGLEALMASSSNTEVVAHKEKRLPVVEESDVVGIEDGTEVVRQMLMKGEARRAVVSIVGMGGLGKTTLAKKVYNHSDVKQHFDCHAWVYVSQEFKVREILLGIAYCVMSLSDEEKKEVKEMGEAELGRKLCGHLQEKKYLVVMDDVWSSEVWSSLRSYLPEAKDGSKVLITTRNEEIAQHAISQEEIASKPLNSEGEIAPHANSQSLIYRLRVMDDEESWLLLLKKTFGNRSTSGILTSELAELEETGRRIVAKCDGLPLAIVVVGGLLSTKEKTKSSWEKVLASIDWYLSQGPESCMGILALSYNDLPYYLKSCFLYCGIFPEDSEIKTSELIRLWLAEGFIQRRGKEPLEDIAEDYFYELIHRSMIQVAARKEDGRVKSCRIHDLLRDLAISEARDTRLFEVHENIDAVFSTSVRRLSIHQHLNISRHLHNSHLRSLIFFTEPLERKSWRSLQEHIKLLTVLVLGMTETNDDYIVPQEIGELVHLKFLRIKGSKRVTLPSSIDRLVNLQSFDLDFNRSYIPCTIWKLQELKYLNCPWGEISSPFKLSACMNGYLGVEKLTNLQALDLLPGSWLEGDGLGKLTQLKKLSLGGWLNPHLKKGFFECIANLTALRTLFLSHLESYEKKTLLNHLRLKRWKNVNEQKTLIPGLMSFSHHTYLYKVFLGGKLELPEQIEFYPPNLLKLSLYKCEQKNDPMFILENLPNLRILVFDHGSYVGEKLVCSSGGFLRLQSLKLAGLYSLDELIVEEGAMPLLRTLKIWGCPGMKKLPRGLLQLKNLEKVEPKSMYDQLIAEVEETKEAD